MHAFSSDKSSALKSRYNFHDLLTFDLCKYCAAGDLDGVERLVKSGVEYEEADYDGRTPLHLCASEGNLEIIKYLFK